MSTRVPARIFAGVLHVVQPRVHPGISSGGFSDMLKDLDPFKVYPKFLQEFLFLAFRIGIWTVFEIFADVLSDSLLRFVLEFLP